MINFERTFPAPQTLSRNSFEGVKEALLSMQSHKCYLCESKNSITTHIEHLKPTAKYPELKYDWLNLFLACDHCNSVKNYNSDRNSLDIMNCNEFEVIISDEIQFSCGPFPKEKVEIKPVNESSLKKVEDTANLLHQIFNYKSESLDFDSKNLTNEVIKEMKKLLDIIHEYEFDAHSPEQRKRKLADIQDILSIHSPFTAFKIWFIKERYANSEFLQLLPKFETS